MSVIGIDFGNETTVAALAHKAQIEILVNEVSRRKTPNIVGFSDAERKIGESGLSTQKSNSKRTISQLKRFIGRHFSAPEVQQDLSVLHVPSFPTASDGVSFEVTNNEGTMRLTPEHLICTLLSQIKQMAERKAETRITDCVISCPPYFTQKEITAVMDACKLAGFSVLRVMKETTALALNYGILRALPEKEAIRVVFVDMGHASTNVAVVSFVGRELTVLSTASDRNLGGRDYDMALARHFNQVIKEKYGIDPSTKPKAFLRLIEGVVKAKLMLSANKDAPMNIECLMEDIDVSLSITRDEFNSLTEHLTRRVLAPVKRALEASQTSITQVHSIEVVGGGTRVPAIRSSLSEFFGKPMSTTLNGDESVARGCALQCAMLSPAFRVRDFQVRDSIPYGVEVCWGPVSEDFASPNCVFEEKTELFARFSALPCIKMISFLKSEPFQIVLRYSHPVEVPPGQAFLARYVITPPVKGEEQQPAPSKIKVKIQMDLHGLVGIKSVQLFEEVKETEVEAPPASSSPPPADADANTAPDANATPDADANGEVPPADADSSASADAEMADGDGSSQPSDSASDAMDVENDSAKSKENEQSNGVPPAEAEKESAPKKKKKKVKKTDLPFDSIISCGMNDDELKHAFEQEVAMANQDRVVQETLEARNALESYVYDTRSKLDHELREFTPSDVHADFLSRLNATEDWLYTDEGYDATKSQYTKRTGELRATGDPIFVRKWEHDNREEAVNILKSTVVKYQMFVQEVQGGDEKFDHITEEEQTKMSEKANEVDAWLVGVLSKQDQRKKHEDPVFTVADGRKKLDDLNNTCYPTMTKKRPVKVEEPEKEKNPAEANSEQAGKTEKSENPGDTEMAVNGEEEVSESSEKMAEESDSPAADASQAASPEVESAMDLDDLGPD